MAWSLFSKKERTGKLIYIVDDEPSVCRLLIDMLSGEGRTVVGNENPLNALEQIKKEPPNLIILDIMMPQMSGWDVLKAVRGSEAMRSIPVLVLTAKDTLGDAERALSLGANDYAQKPINPERIRQKVRTLLML